MPGSSGAIDVPVFVRNRHDLRDAKRDRAEWPSFIDLFPWQSLAAKAERGVAC
jgi:hypothetical protein